jgi:hypothetical protein
VTESIPNPAARAAETRRRAFAVGVLLPVVLTGLAAVLAASWVPDLPDPVAVHWAGDTPDGFGSVWLFVLMPIGICGLFGTFLLIAAARPTPAGLLTASQKFTLVTSTWMAGLLSVGFSGTLWVQRGLDDAADASGGAIWMLWGLLAGFAVAVPAWFVLPKADTSGAAGERPEPIVPRSSELVTWSRAITLARGPRLLVAAVLIAELIVGIAVGASGAAGGLTILAMTAVLLLVAVATFSWRVTVDRRGLVVRSVLGWPRVSVPLDQVRDVEVVDVQPVADFGGWGWRYGPGGRSAIVLRGGAAIQVTRSNGKRFVVPVEDASTGAGVLAGLVAG